jgi:hypothetical protein
MAMLMADRDLGDRWHLQLKGMASLDPYLGPTGYPTCSLPARSRTAGR